uniref:2Fe-2S ferredoxin-type domain-containing protein n=1 Tax=Prasinoderma singulare TaxID=676789 RepID=A0A7S3BDF3_9VIRI
MQLAQSVTPRAAPLAARRSAGTSRATRRICAVACERPKVAVEVREGASVVKTFEENCADKLLRDALLGEGVGLYKGFAKLSNCSGAGQCGMCIVDVVQDDDGLLGSREAVEEQKLRGKPETWRLACQTSLGQDDDIKAGSVTVAVKP